jgi:AcrR family transcriptional regulator
MRTVMPYHHGNLRNALLQAGERLLRQDGVAELSLRKVAREAGVSHTAPYRHFQNKRALLSALAQDGFDRLANAMQKAEKKYPDDPRRQLQEAGVAYVILAVRHPETTHLMFGGVLNACEDDPELMEAGQKAFQGLLKIVSNGQREGIYRNRETMELALAAWSLVHGLAMLLIAGQLRDTVTTEEEILRLVTGLGDLLQTGMLK